MKTKTRKTKQIDLKSQIDEGLERLREIGKRLKTKRHAR